MNRTLLWTPVMQDNVLQGLSVKHTQTTSRTEHFLPRFLPQSLMLLKCLPHHFFLTQQEMRGHHLFPYKFLIIIYILHTPKEKQWIPVRSTVLLWGLWGYGHAKVNFGSEFFFFEVRAATNCLFYLTFCAFVSMTCFPFKRQSAIEELTRKRERTQWVTVSYMTELWLCDVCLRRNYKVCPSVLEICTFIRC